MPAISRLARRDGDATPYPFMEAVMDLTHAATNETPARKRCALLCRWSRDADGRLTGHWGA
jgi:hypothetical protein